MRGIIWDNFSSKEQEEYISFLKIFGALSGLFKDNKEGVNAKKPYLYYRNHEQLYSRVFHVEDLTRKDSAFDAVAQVGDKRVGIGLKTWIHSRNLTFQKVAEFNKLAPTEIRPLIEQGKEEDVIYKVAQLRNDRVKLDQRQYNTNFDIYHCITRDDNVMNIVELNYDLIDVNSLKLISSNGKTYSFTDGKNNYKYYNSKSVLLKEFNASEDRVVRRIEVDQFDDPFKLIEMIHLPQSKEESEAEEVVYLPLYSDNGEMEVKEKSGFNSWNGASKNKGSNIPRPAFEAYVIIPVWVHRFKPNFFGFNALDKEERAEASSFTLHLPDGREIQAIVTQDNGKSLQTNPQSILGKWVLHDVLGLQAREMLTMERLMELGVDSLKIIKVDNDNFKIELAETYAFEKWKIDNRDQIEAVVEGKRGPMFRDSLFEELDESEVN